MSIVKLRSKQAFVKIFIYRYICCVKNTKKYTLEIQYNETDDVLDFIKEKLEEPSYDFEMPEDPTMFNKCIAPLIDENTDDYFMILDVGIYSNFVIGDT